jgi:hypothetical protein
MLQNRVGAMHDFHSEREIEREKKINNNFLFSTLSVTNVEFQTFFLIIFLKILRNIFLV